MQRYFQISCHALVVSAFFSLALTGRLDPPAIVVFIIAVAVSCYMTIQGMPAPLSARGALLLSFGYIFFFLLDTWMVSGSFIFASIHLVLFLQLVKLFQEKTDKDYFYLIVLSFLQILAASSLTIDMTFVATLFFFVVALVATLMSFDMYRSERKNRAQAQQVVMPLSGMSLWATLWIIFTGIVLFLMIPRVGTGYFTQVAAQSLLVSGFGDSVELGEIGQVKLGTAVVMHVRQISGPPFAALKWRGIVLNHFDGRSWLRTNRKRFPLRLPHNGEYSIQPVVQVSNAARYEILLEPLATNALFGPHQVRAVSGRIHDIEYDNDDSVYLRFPPAQRFQYQVLSEIPDRRIFVDSSTEDPIPDGIKSRYLQLPGDMDPRITQLATEITNKGKSTFERASLIEAYLKRNYRYTLNLTWAPGRQPLSTFLFDAKNGHCEYFASSMAILLRAVGIPTRLVNGFLMGEYNPVASDYVIRQSSAHSWVEVYVPGRGWIEFDPTPPDPNRRDPSLAGQIWNYVDAMEVFWNSYVIVYDSGAQRQLFRSAQDRVQSLQLGFREVADEWIPRAQRLSDRLSDAIPDVLGTVPFWIILAAVLIGAASHRYRRRLSTQLQIWRIRRGRCAATEGAVEHLFYRAARIAERTAPKRQNAQTWREWIFGLPDPQRRSILARALVVFEKSKYGRLPVSAADFALLEEAVRNLKVRPAYSPLRDGGNILE
jgi:transglutaminase-like putative cysteine protease